VPPDRPQTTGQVYQLDASNNVTPLPISVDPTKGAVYLSVYGTGIANAQTVAVTVGGQPVPVTYFGAQGYSNPDGLDQVNIGPLPPSLAGRGRVNIILTADGQTANPVEIYIQ